MNNKKNRNQDSLRPNRIEYSGPECVNGTVRHAEYAEVYRRSASDEARERRMKLENKMKGIKKNERK